MKIIIFLLVSLVLCCGAFGQTSQIYYYNPSATNSVNVGKSQIWLVGYTDGGGYHAYSVMYDEYNLNYPTPLQPLTTQARGAVLSGNISWTFSITTVAAGGGTCYVTPGTFVVTAGQDFTLNAYNTAPPCTTNLTFYVFNNDVVNHTYCMRQRIPAGGFVDGGAVDAENLTIINAGQSDKLGCNVLCDDAYLVGVYRVDHGNPTNSFGGANSVFVPVPAAEVGYPQDGSDPGLGTNAIPGSSTPTPITYDANGTNPPSNIIWSSTNSDSSGVVSAVHDVGKALYDSSVKNAIQEHGDSAALLAAVKNIPTNVTVSGGTGSGSNVWVNNFPTGTCVGMSNLLASQNSSTVVTALSNSLAGFDFSASNSFAGAGAVMVSNMNAFISGTHTNNDALFGGLTNLFSQLGDSTNADIATEGTLQGISNLLVGIGGTLTNGSFNGGTNGGGLTLTNYAEETTLEGISNLLSEFATTNGENTNILSSYTNGMVTTADAANAASAAAFSAVGGTLDTMIAGAGTIFNGDGMGAGSEIDVSIPMGTVGGHPVVMRIRPEESEFATLFSIVKKVFKWVLTIAYIGKVVKYIQWVIFHVMAGRGIRMLPMFFEVAGTGGNFAGAVLMPIIIVATMGLWAAWLATFLASMTGAIDWSGMIGNTTASPFATVEAGALHLLLACFPLDLAFSLVSAFILFRITATKLVVIVLGALRMLPGA